MVDVDETICRSYDEDFSALLDGELAAERELELQAHLEECARCQTRVDGLRRVDEELVALGAPTVPEDLRARLQARLDAEDTRVSAPTPGRAAPPRRRRWLGSPLAAAALAAAAAIALYLALSPERAPLPGSGLPEPPIAKEDTPAQQPPQHVLEAPVPVEVAEQPRPESMPELSPESPRELAALEAEPVDDVAVAIDLETIEDFDVIANLELLEALVAMEEGTG